MTKTFVLQKSQPKEFKVDYQKELNEEQYQAVAGGEGPCLVLAGAGSGKTRTIVYRVAYLIERGVSPENILLVTFTNKAAREMLERVENLLGSFPAGLWGGTFHHIANRLLRKYAPALGYQSNFTILDEEDSKDLVKLCLKDENIDVKARRFPSPAVLKSLISFAKNSQIPLEKIIEEKHPKWLQLSDQIIRVAGRYEQKKQTNNSMDFDDLLINWLKLLQTKENIKNKLATQFQYILVDEYQDTNYIQAAIIRELASVHQNVFVVGDDAQSIYSFRAADIGNIINFPKIFPNSKIFKLETNYRSTPEILELANQIIKNNPDQFPKKLRPVLESFVKPNMIPSSSAREEAEFISQQILQLREEGVALNKIAVLFRASYHSQELEFELTRRDIPYDYRGGLRFFERSHIKDALAFLKVMANFQDEVSWQRILTLQVGIGGQTAGKIFNIIRQAKNIQEVFELPIESSLGSKGSLGWHNLKKIFINKINISENDPALIIRSIAKSDYRNYLEAEFPNWQERLDDLEQLALFSERYDDLISFVGEISLQEGFGLQKSQADTSDDEKIVLSTIHQAKGLEWQAVFVINLTDTAFPNQRALSEDKGIEEERRLFYVAVTRAQKQLFLSYPLISNYSTMTINTPSRFLEEIDSDKLEAIKLINDYQDLNKNSDGIQYLPDLDSLI